MTPKSSKKIKKSVSDYDSGMNTMKTKIMDLVVSVLPKKYQLHARWGILLGIMLLGAGLFVTSFIPKKDIPVGQQAVLGASTTAVIDTDFTDLGKFSNLENLNFISTDPLIGCIETEQTGNIIFYQKSLGPKFAASYEFVPLGVTKANSVLQYDSLYRIIVGENGFRALSLERNANYPNVPTDWVKVRDQERQATQRYIGGDGFKPDTNIELKVTSAPLGNQLHLQLEVIHQPLINNLGGASRSARFSYSLDLPSVAESISGQLGVGMISPIDQRLCTQFIHLTAEKYDLE